MDEENQTESPIQLWCWFFHPHLFRKAQGVDIADCITWLNRAVMLDPSSTRFTLYVPVSNKKVKYLPCVKLKTRLWQGTYPIWLRAKLRPRRMHLFAVLSSKIYYFFSPTAIFYLCKKTGRFSKVLFKHFFTSPGTADTFGRPKAF